MDTIDSKNTSADYTDAVTIQNVWDSNGGFAIVTGADVFLELQYGQYGTSDWTREVHIPQNSPIVLDKGTVGVRFRDYKSGVHATISGALASASEPPIVLTNPGTIKVSSTPTFDPVTYGAVGDNVKDDSGAWQSAENAAAAVGGTVLPTPPPGGAYYIKNSILIPNLSENTGHLVNDGGGVQLRTDQAISIFKRTISDVSQAGSAIANAGDLVFRDFVLNGGGVAGSKGIEFHASYNMRIEGVHLVTLDRGLDLAYCLKALIMATRGTNCKTYDIRLGSGYGLWTGSPGVSAGYGCNVSVIVSHRSYAGVGETASISIYNTEDVAIYESICEGNNPVSSIDYDDAGSTVCKALSIHGLHIEHAPTRALFSCGITGILELHRINSDQNNVTWVDTTFGSGSRSPLHIFIPPGSIYGFATGNLIGKINPGDPFQWTIWYPTGSDTINFKAAAQWAGGNAPTVDRVNDIKLSRFNFRTFKGNGYLSDAANASANTGLQFGSGVDEVDIYSADFKVWDPAATVTPFEIIPVSPVASSRIGAYGATPVVQPSAVGTATGYTAGGTAATFHSDDTYTGNVGTTGYTINGIVAALKTIGWLKL